MADKTLDDDMHMLKGPFRTVCGAYTFPLTGPLATLIKSNVTCPACLANMEGNDGDFPTAA